MKIATLCYLVDRKNNSVLLGKKKEGFAKGIICGLGGKLEPTDKSIKHGIIREMKEEAHIRVSPNLAGIMHFYYQDIPKHCAYIYIAEEWQGKVKDSDEVEVAWHDLAALPYENMWPDDKLWLPTLFAKPGLVIHSFRKEPGDFPYKLTLEFGKDLYEGVHESKRL